MGTRDTYQKTLVTACVAVGDETALARKLDVPVGAVVDWLLGDRPLPAEVFLRSVDIVLGSSRQRVRDTRRQIQRNRDLLEQIRRRHR